MEVEKNRQIQLTTKQAILPATILALFIFVGVWFVMKITAYFVTPALTGNSQVTQPDNVSAYVRSQTIVKAFLKAPSTAKFASYEESTVSVDSSGWYTVISYVDSQNSFGAMLRSNWIVKYRYQTSDEYGPINIQSVIIDGKEVYK